MMRSLYSAVSGLKTHQTKMDVIGNNIANVNTVAFKATSVNFYDVMYQTTQKASGSNALTGTGGVNAKQIGLGVNTASMKVSITSEGAAQSTGEALDVKLSGDSFFVVNDGKSNLYTRDGSFYIDGEGNLCMSSTGYNIMGWTAIADASGARSVNTSGAVGALRVMDEQNSFSAPLATSKATVSGILDKNTSALTSTTSGYTMTVTIYDNEGNSYTVKYGVLSNEKTALTNDYYVCLDDILDSNGKSILDGMTVEQKAKLWGPGGDVVTLPAESVINLTLAQKTATLGQTNTFDMQNDVQRLGSSNYGVAKVDGDLKYYSLKANGEWEEADSATVNDNTILGLMGYANPGKHVTDGVKDITYSLDTTNGFVVSKNQTVNAYTLEFEPDTGVFSNVGGAEAKNNGQVSLNLSQLSNGEIVENRFSDITVDFNSVKNYDNAGTSTMGVTRGITVNGAVSGTGRVTGTLTGLSVQTNGMIYGSYDNGDTILLGQIAVAGFANASGLESQGNNCYSVTLNSGDPTIKDVTADGGSMATGQLEMSNVDLSTQFTDMITTQRGFQANSRVITTSDTLLEELINLKR